MPKEAGKMVTGLFVGLAAAILLPTGAIAHKAQNPGADASPQKMAQNTLTPAYIGTLSRHPHSNGRKNADGVIHDFLAGLGIHQPPSP